MEPKPSLTWLLTFLIDKRSHGFARDWAIPPRAGRKQIVEDFHAVAIDVQVIETARIGPFPFYIRIYTDTCTDIDFGLFEVERFQVAAPNVEVVHWKNDNAYQAYCPSDRPEWIPPSAICEVHPPPP